jgi:hypothetical protein
MDENNNSIHKKNKIFSDHTLFFPGVIFTHWGKEKK